MPHQLICQKCGGFGVIEREWNSPALVWRCIQCGRQEYVHTPNDSDSTKTPDAKRTTRRSLRRAVVPDLAPPSAPTTDEDFEGAYEIECATYAGYRHFLEQARVHAGEAGSSSTKSDKLAANYRARLCENLASILARIYMRQSREVLREQLTKQRRAGHAIKNSDRGLIRWMKQYADLMLQAITHLPNDPIVKDWRGSVEATGQWDYLRKARKGLEHGIERPYPSTQAAMTDLTIRELAAEGFSITQIQRELRLRNLQKLSRQAIHKRINTNASSK